MTESEGKHISFTWSPEPKPESQHQEDLRNLARQKQELEKLSVRLYGTAELVREVWPGKAYELARKVRDELGPDWIQPGKFTAALEQACRRYKQKNGRPFTAKNLRESFRQWYEGPKGPNSRPRLFL